MRSVRQRASPPSAELVQIPEGDLVFLSINLLKVAISLYRRCSSLAECEDGFRQPYRILKHMIGRQFRIFFGGGSRPYKAPQPQSSASIPRWAEAYPKIDCL
jgi:hypothetical protein